MSNTATQSHTDVTAAVSVPRQGFVARTFTRARLALSGLFATLAILVGVTPAHAAAPAPPVVGDVVSDAAGQLSNGLLDGFVEILPYAIPVLIVFTVVGYVWTMLKAKKKPV